MRDSATLVLYERHGHPAVGYRTETIDQIAHGDVAEGTRGAWELRCWTLAGGSSGYGVASDELVALVSAVFRTIRYCLDNARPLAAIQRFHCSGGGIVGGLPGCSPLAEHLAIWSKSVASNDVFLQARNVSTEQLRSSEHGLRREITAMAKVKDELFRRSRATAATKPSP